MASAEPVTSHDGEQREAAAMMRTEQEFGDSSMSTKILAPRLADYPVTTVEKLRLADTDRLGHITNAVFAVCCQNARMELLRDPKRVPIPHNTQFVIAKLVLESRAEMHWPGTVEIGTCAERVGRSSATLAQALFVDQRCVAVSESVVALMDTKTRRSMLLPHDATEGATPNTAAKLRLGTHPSEHRPSPPLRTCENAQTLVAARAG